MKKTILFIAGLVAGSALYAQTQTDTVKTKKPASEHQVSSTPESIQPTNSKQSSIKDIEYESWDSYYNLASSEFYQQSRLMVDAQSMNRKEQKHKKKD